jgi:hypothetical protein
VEGINPTDQNEDKRGNPSRGKRTAYILQDHSHTHHHGGSHLKWDGGI